MANGAGIPKSMNIVPQVLGVNQFIADTKRVSGSVSRMVTGVNQSLSRLGATSKALGSSSAQIQKANNAINSSLSTMNKWAGSINLANNGLTRFGSSLDQVGQRISRLSMQMERVGRSMTLFLTLPILAFGAASIKAGIDFERGMLKVQNLVGTSAKNIQLYRDTILDTSTALGQLPTDLAAGLFAAASGFGALGDSAEVLEVLTAASKGSTIGLGEMEDVARVTTAIINAFGKEAGDAETIVSTLTIAVREGNFEVDKLATALGNVLGTATAVNASSSDVLAFVSAYTRFGVEPARAVTALNTALTNLVKPSDQNRAVLESYGLTLEGIKSTIEGPDGLAGLLIRMRGTLSEQEFIDVFGLRSLRAVLALTDGINAATGEVEGFAATYAGISTAIRDETILTAEQIGLSASEASASWVKAMEEAGDLRATSVLAESFARITDTIEFKLGQLRSGIQGVFIGVSDAINAPLKVLADRLIVVVERMEAWIRENQEAVTVLVALGLSLAALGPALIIFAKIGQSIGFFTSILGTFVKVIGLAVGGVLQLGFQLGILAINIGARLVQGFVLLTGVVFNAAAAFTALIAKAVLWIALELAGSIGVATGAFISLIASIGPVIIALGIVGAVALAAVGAFATLWDAISDVASTIAEAFVGPVEKARGWGRNIIDQFTIGIVDGFIELVKVLNEIGTILAGWLEPGSPPKIAPDIDDWGTATMQEWINGWLKADFSIFNQIQDRIESFLKSMAAAAGDETDEGLIARTLLGSREAIAEAINQIRTLGQVTQATMDRIFAAIGSTTAEMQEYIAATLAAAATTQKLADAQQRVNDINEKYSKLLDPIQDQLSEIDRQRQGISDSRELERLNRLIERGNLPEQVERLARLRVQEINLQQQESDLESQRDAELSIAEQQLALAQADSDAAQRRLEFAEGALDLQTKGFDLMSEMKKAIDDIGKTLKSIADKVGDIASGAGGLNDFDLPTPDSLDFGTGGLTEPIESATAKLEDLKLELGNLATTWGLVWTNATASLSLWWADTQRIYQEYKTKFLNKFGPTLEVLETEGRRTWGNLSDIISRFWNTARPKLESYIETMGAVGDIALENAPTAIKQFSDIVNNLLLPALDTIAQFIAEDPFTRLLLPLAGPFGALGVLPGLLTSLDELDAWFKGVLNRMVDGIGGFITAAFDSIYASVLEFAENAGLTDEQILETIGLTQVAVEDAVATFLKWFSDKASELSETSIAGFGQELLDFFTEGGETISLAFSDATDAIQGLFDTADDESGALDIVSGKVDSLGLGVGLFTGTVGLSTSGLELLRLKLIEIYNNLITLKDEALETVRLKIEEVRLKVEEWIATGELWRAKVEELVTWVLNLASRMEIELMTALTTVSNFISATLNLVLENLLGWFTEIYKYLKEKLERALFTINEKFDALSTTVSNMLEPLRELIGLLESAWNWWKKARDIKKVGTGSDDDGDGGGGGGDDDPTTNTASVAGVSAAAATQVGVAAATAATTAGFAQGAALPTGIGASAIGAISQISGSASTFNSSSARRRRQAGSLPTVIASPGSQVIASGGVSIQFGDVVINNEMDMVTFETRVRTVVSQSITD